ncbi:hypothetical protein AGMMS49957_17790 [Synergistales bacterium]|nr:hypothetical protein AGMMS49957_17790 [Synergistales bacterium]
MKGYRNFSILSSLTKLFKIMNKQTRENNTPSAINNVDFMPDNSGRNNVELTERVLAGKNSREVSGVEERKKIDYRTLRTESGRSIGEADKSELIITPDGSPALGFVDEETAKDAGIVAGEIHVNAGMIQHTEAGSNEGGRHSEQIRKAGYKDSLNMVLDVLENYTEIRQGSDDSVLLVKRAKGIKSPTVAVVLVKDEGNYRATTAWLVREDFLEKKKLLSARSATPATSSDSGLTSLSGDSNFSEESPVLERSSGEQSKRTLPPPNKNVNSSDTDTQGRFTNRMTTNVTRTAYLT